MSSRPRPRQNEKCFFLLDRCRRWQRFFLNGVTHQTPPPLSARPSAIYTADASHLNVGLIDSVVQVRRRAARIDRRKMNGSCPCLVHSVASIHPLGGHLGPDRLCSSSDLTAASASQRRRRLRLLGQLTSLSAGVAVIRPEAYGRRLVFSSWPFRNFHFVSLLMLGRVTRRQRRLGSTGVWRVGRQRFVTVRRSRPTTLRDPTPSAPDCQGFWCQPRLPCGHFVCNSTSHVSSLLQCRLGSFFCC